MSFTFYPITKSYFDVKLIIGLNYYCHPSIISGKDLCCFDAPDVYFLFFLKRVCFTNNNIW